MADSQATQDRARKNNVELVSTDLELCNAADFILSIVPPKDAIATARRIAKVSSSPEFKRRDHPLYFLDLNAISPQSAREIDALLSESSSDVKFIDGGIIGGPPKKKEDGTWSRPNVVVSGPHRLSQAQPAGEDLTELMNMKHINETIGSATGAQGIKYIRFADV